MRLSSLLLSLAFMASLPTNVRAQAPATAETTPDAIQALRAELEAAKAEGADRLDQIDALSTLLQNASIMLDNRRSTEERVKAVEELGKTANPRALSLLWAASHTPDPQVRAATISVANLWDHPDAIALLVARTRSPLESRHIQDAALRALGESGRTAGADALFQLARDKSVDQQVRSGALSTLDEHFPDYMKDKERPSTGGDLYGHTAAIGGNGLAGGIMLGSVGIWGQGDAAVAIGGLGGTAIGAGTAALYLSNHPISRGQGFAYASNVAWGLAGSMMLTHTIYGHQGAPEIEGDADHRNMGALLRTAGVGLGAATGYRRMDSRPSFEDVMEVNAAGLLGSQFARSGTRMVQAFSETEFDCDLMPDHAQSGCWNRQERYERARSRVRAGASIGGAALGLTVATLNQDAWAPDRADALFSGVVGIETAIVGGLVSSAIDSDLDGTAFVNFGLMAGSTAALFAAHHQPVSVEQSTLMGYGAASGNLFGGGINLLLGEHSSDRTLALISVPAGVAGTITGGWAAEHLDLDTGDWTMVGVGTALSAAQLSATTYVLSEYGVFSDTDPEEGIILTGTSLSSAAFMAATRKVDPEPLDSLFIGGTTAWGALYGSVGQVALDTDLSDGNAVLVTTLAADAGLGVGALILSDKTDLTPRQTLVPQLFGVTGATLGALAAMLATDEAQPVAIGTLTGGTLGLVAGGIIAPKLKLGGDSASAPWIILPMPHVDLPGDWSFHALPTVGQDGKMGTALSLSAQGF